MLPGPCQPHNKGLEATLTFLAGGSLTFRQALSVTSITLVELFGGKARESAFVIINELRN